MPSLWVTLACAVLITAYWTCLGAPIARRLFQQPLAMPLAPALGWALHTGAALPVFLVCRFSATTVTALSVLLLAASVALGWSRLSNSLPTDATWRVLGWAYAAAFLLSLIPMAAVMPKVTLDGVALSAPVFDHAKIALIDEIARFGIPPTNPFFEGAGGSSRLAYYYAWHFSAAEVARVFGLDGWTADAALTAFTAFSSLTLMMGLAGWLAIRSSAAALVLLLSAAGSLRPLLNLLLGAESVDRVLSTYPGLAGWLVQASWVPQHLASATCVVLAALLVTQLGRPKEPLTVPSLALVASAAFASSTWVGGVVAALAMPAVACVVLGLSTNEERKRLVIRLVLAGALTLALAFPLLHDQYFATAARHGGSPIAFHPYEVIGTWVSDPLRRWVDLPAYWLLLLPVAFPAIAFIGPLSLFRSIAIAEGCPDRRRTIAALGALAFVSLATTWLLISTIGNNDLGWRALLPGILVVTATAASGLSELLGRPLRLATAFALAAVALGALDGFYVIRSDLAGRENTDARAFAQSPDLWAAVRKHAGPTDRVANNPLMLKDMLPWPVDISWALLSHRRTCFAGWELTRAYAALPREVVRDIDAQFTHVFAGSGSEADVRDLATKYGCTIVVVTPADGGWTKDVFGATGAYALIEAGEGWKIFRARQAGTNSAKP